MNSSLTPTFRYRYLAIGIILAAAGALVFGWFAAIVRDGESAFYDEAIRTTVHSANSPALTAIFKTVSFTGKAVFLFVAGALVLAVLAYLRRSRDIKLFLVTMIGEMILEPLLKVSYMRARPAPFFDLPPPESYSFPSGHALGSFCLYGVVAFIVIRNTDIRWVQIITAAAACLLILAIGFSRIYLGMHFPSDVLGGYMVGAIWLSTVLYYSRPLRLRADGDAHTHTT